MTVDEAYIKCTGKTFKEFKDKKEKMRQDLIRREEEHKKKIPELTKYWIKEGHKVLSQDKWDEWDRCVPIRLFFWDDMFTNIKQWKDDLDIEIKTTWQEYKPTINELLNFRDGDKAIQYLVERGLNTNSLMK